MTATSEHRTLDEVDHYLADVAEHLAHLGPEERGELLDDLDEHLREVAAEDGPPLAQRLGSPEQFAGELLASAGLATPASGRHTRFHLPRIRALVARVTDNRIWREGADAAGSLRPAWWLARGYLAVSLLSALLPAGGRGFPVPRLAGSSVLGAGAVAVAVWASVRLARNEHELGPVRKRGLGVAQAALVVYGAVLATDVGFADTGNHVVQYQNRAVPSDNCLRDGTGERITNLYPYDAQGNLLSDVMLFDDAGRPIDNLCPEHDRQGRPLATEYAEDANGADVYGVFPRSQSIEAWENLSPGADGIGSPRLTPVRPPAVVVPRLAEPDPGPPLEQPAAGLPPSDAGGPSNPPTG